jgi:DNA sulfur modification protein DndE
MTHTTKILMAGDSTMANYPAANPKPQIGWGQAFTTLFPPGVVDNRAIGGRSTMNFQSQGHWARLVADIHVGDWVIIQFAHNDQKAADPARFTQPTGAYRENLVRFVHDVRDHGGNPVLATPISRRHFDDQGILKDTHGQYAIVTREVATRLDVPLLDLQHITTNLILSHGIDASKLLFLWIPQNAIPNLPDGAQDNTHLSRYGADLIAYETLLESKRLGLSLADLALPIQPKPNPI